MNWRELTSVLWATENNDWAIIDVSFGNTIDFWLVHRPTKTVEKGYTQLEAAKASAYFANEITDLLTTGKAN